MAKQEKEKRREKLRLAGKEAGQTPCGFPPPEGWKRGLDRKRREMKEDKQKNKNKPEPGTNTAERTTRHANGERGTGRPNGHC